VRRMRPSCLIRRSSRESRTTAERLGTAKWGVTGACRMTVAFDFITNGSATTLAGGNIRATSCQPISPSEPYAPWL
jgi:hypothetical protein